MDLEKQPDRRSLLCRGAGAALLALAGGAVAATANKDAAGAANGDPLLMGAANLATTSTGVNVPEFYFNGGLSPNPLVFITAEQTTIPLRLLNAPITIPPASGSCLAGSFTVSDNQLWYCYGSGTGAASLWTRLSTPSLNILAAPFRVYDSRPGQPNPSGSPTGALALGHAPRTINCAPAVPAPASAILFNLTIAETQSAGSLLVWAAGQSEPLASSINWTAGGQVVANSMTSACDATQAVQVAVSSGVAGAGTQFILDVIGYYA